MKTILLPPSKSVLHRELIAAFLACRSQNSLNSFAEKAAALLPPACSEDLAATRDSLLALGEALHLIEERGRALPDDLLPLLPCRESGTTLRLLLPIAAALGMPALFKMEGRLPARPMDPLLRVLEEHGCRITRPAPNLLQTEGSLTPGTYSLPGHISSQYFSGLLFALPLLRENSVLRSETPLESLPYVEMTTEVLRAAGIPLTPGSFLDKNGCFRLTVPGSCSYRKPKHRTAEGDWSGAAFWLAVGLLGEEDLTLRGLSEHSLQGDRSIIALLRRFGGDIEIKKAIGESKRKEENGEGARREDVVLVHPSRARLHAPEKPIDVSSVPDLVPPLALVAALAEGTTILEHAKRLRLKESDRLHTVTETLCALGADIREQTDGLIITGVPSLHGGSIDPAGDHRIAMTAITAASSFPADGTKAPVLLRNPSCIAKSYPSFLADFRRIYPKAPLETL